MCENVVRAMLLHQSCICETVHDTPDAGGGNSRREVDQVAMSGINFLLDSVAPGIDLPSGSVEFSTHGIPSEFKRHAAKGVVDHSAAEAACVIASCG